MTDEEKIKVAFRLLYELLTCSIANDKKIKESLQLIGELAKSDRMGKKPIEHITEIQKVLYS